MIPSAQLLQGGFLIVFLLWYSVNVWHAMDGYFKDEFKKYLEKEYEQNKQLKRDMVGKTDSSKADTERSIHGTTVKEGIGNTETSFTTTKYDDAIKQNYNDVKQNKHDVSKSDVPKLETRSPFMSKDTKSYVSTIQHTDMSQRKGNTLHTDD